MSDQHDEVAAQRALRELRSQWQPALDADSDALDADIAARLEQVRTQALLATTIATGGRRRMLLGVPAIAAAFLILALPLTPKLMKNIPQHDQLGVPAVSALDLDISELEPWQEDVELLDDLDFYAWLELEAAHAS